MSTGGGARPVQVVGRDEEVAGVDKLVDAVRSGVGGCLFFVGEAGAGKTVLLNHAQARADGLTVLVAQGRPGESALSYAGLHRLLHPVAGQLERWSTPGAMATLGDALRLPSTGPVDPTAVAVATLDLLHALAAHRPVLVVVDDLHQLDPDSRAVLAFLIGRTEPAAIAFLGASRDETVALDLPGLPIQRLAGFDESAVAELLAVVAAVPTPAAVRRALTAGTGGNPRALVELADLLTADQLRGVRVLPDPLPLGTATEWAFTEPVRQLPVSTQRVLALAATEPTLDTAALSRAAGALDESLDALGAAEDAGLVTVDVAGVAFVHPLTRSAAYHLASAQGRRTAHEVIAGVCPDRSAAHRAAIAREPCEELAAELAVAAARVRAAQGHAAAADHMQRAAELTPAGAVRRHRFYVAATDAWLGGDPVRAVALLEVALPDTSRPDTSRPDASRPDTSRPDTSRSSAARSDRAGSGGHGSDDEVAAGKVELLRAQIMLRCGNVIDAYERLLAAATRFEGHSIRLATRACVAAGMAAWFAGDLDRFAQAAQRAKAVVGDRLDELPPPVQVGLHYLTGLTAQFAGRTEEAAGPLGSVVDAALEVDDPSSIVLAAACAMVGGDRPLVHGLATRGLTAARDAGATAVIPHAIEVITLAECWSGRYPLSQPITFEGLHLARQTGQSNSECHLLAMLAMGAAISGHTDECHYYARAADRIARDHGVGLVIATANWAIAMLDVVHARWTPAYQRLGRLYRTAPGAGHPVVALTSAPYFIEAAAAAVGKADRARRVLDIYEQWADTAKRPGMLAIAARGRALLADGTDAEPHYREAMRQHHRSDRDFERAYSELLFARYLRRNRQRSEARDRLHGALEVFERLELSLWTKRVRAELRAVGERDAGKEPAAEKDRTIRASGLTAQQLQIARLIAEGATNREVAERLFVSPRTIDYHLRNIFQRLSITSRAELIRRFG